MAHINNNQLNIVLLASIIALSILSISWHHQIFTLYKQINRENTRSYQITALNKQLLSEQSQVISGKEIREKATLILNMKSAQSEDMGKWFKGRILL